MDRLVTYDLQVTVTYDLWILIFSNARIVQTSITTALKQLLTRLYEQANIFKQKLTKDGNKLLVKTKLFK